MIRPEVRDMAWRWREALVGGAVVVLGAWLLATSSGLGVLFGLALVLAGGVLAIAGLRQGRFRRASDAPGVVQTVEGRITYMGPVTGGGVALDELTEVAFHRKGDMAFWRLSHTEGAPLHIPDGALGADLLLDALAPLPGLDGGEMVRAVQSRTDGTRILWRRTARPVLT